MILKAFGSTECKGASWDARYASPVITLWGSTELDFTQAQLGEGETEIVVVSGLGHVGVTVPDDIPVMVTGMSGLGNRVVLGETDDGIFHGTDRASPDFATAAGRRLRLSIFNLCGSVDVRRTAASSTSSTVPPMMV